MSKYHENLNDLVLQKLMKKQFIRMRKSKNSIKNVKAIELLSICVNGQ